MKRTALLALALSLLAGRALATTYTSTKSGIWSDTTAWTPTPGAGGPSGDGNLVVIASGHTITLDAAAGAGQNGAVTIGDSATPANLAVSGAASGTGVLSVSSGCSLTVLSNVRQANATWSFAAGTTLTFNSSTALTWQIADAHSQANAQLNLTGTSGSRITVQSTGAANGSFTNGGFLRAGKANCQYVDFIKIGVASSGTGTQAAWTIYPSSGDTFSWRSCTFDSNCGRIESTASLAADAIFRLEDCVHDSTGQCLSAGLSSANALTTGTRSIQRNYFAGTLGNSSNGGTWRDCTIVGNVTWGINGLSGANNGLGWTFAGNLIRRTGNTNLALLGSTSEANTWNYLHAHNNGSQIGNMHALGFNGSASVNLNGWIFDPGNTDATGDWIVAASPGSALAYGVNYCLFLPVAAGTSIGLHSGTSVSCLGSANFSCSITHLTQFGDADNGENGAVRVGETYNGYAGMLTAVKSILSWSNTSGRAATLVCNANNAHVSDIAAAASCDFNATWNGITSGAAGGIRGYKDYSSAPANAMFSSTAALGANDVTLAGNPFVDVDMAQLRWRHIGSWAVAKGQALPSDAYNTRSDAAYAYIRAGAPTGQVGARIADLVRYVKAGWCVKAKTLLNAGHDGATIGALPYASPGSGAAILPSASIDPKRVKPAA